jgi:hypothetical protein
MGLDMHLTGTRYLWNHVDGDVRKENEIINVFPEIKPFAVVGSLGVRKIEVDFGYWRKANAIHKWFVDNIQQGRDDCGEYYISVEELQMLLDVVNEILADKSKAPELLPTQSGFFYGNTEYDEWYWKDIEYTKELLEKITNSGEDLKGWQLQYSSSW